MFFETKQQYVEMKQQWATIAAQKQITPQDHVIYNILRGKPANRGFSPLKDANKLNNGMTANGAFNRAQSVLLSLELWQKYYNTKTKEEQMKAFNAPYRSPFMKTLSYEVLLSLAHEPVSEIV